MVIEISLSNDSMSQYDFKFTEKLSISKPQKHSLVYQETLCRRGRLQSSETKKICKQDTRFLSNRLSSLQVKEQKKIKNFKMLENDSVISISRTSLKLKNVANAAIF